MGEATENQKKPTGDTEKDSLGNKETRTLEIKINVKMKDRKVRVRGS